MYCNKLRLSIITLFLILLSCGKENDPEVPAATTLQLVSIHVNDQKLDLHDHSKNTSVSSNAPIVVLFSSSLNEQSVSASIELKEKSSEVMIPVTVSLVDNRSISILPDESLEPNKEYLLTILSSLKGSQGETFAGFSISFFAEQGELTIVSVEIANQVVNGTMPVTGVPLESAQIKIQFAEPLADPSLQSSKFQVSGNGSVVPTAVVFSEDKAHVTITVNTKLRDLTRYHLNILNTLQGENGEGFNGYLKSFYTTTDETPDHVVVSDDELLTLVQEQTFKYFYEFAHPTSGMARERNTSADVVTTGGTGFGIMSLIVGIERNFITRSEGLAYFDKILTFLENADRFHGVWPHWLNGNTGEVLPFSANDNGGDLVETSFLVQGLLTFRQYLNPAIESENLLIERINVLWNSVEWDWYTQEGQKVLYWHWSPDKGWIMNHQIKGYNEAMITYVLAASSSSHGIEAEVYHNGWAANGNIINGKQYYRITLPLGFDFGGPLFFAHYSFLGLDPRNLSDSYANYWTQNVSHSLINQAHAINNPKRFVGYSEENWGLTASDNQDGYSAHSPTNDLGVISPTAALSSFPYTPEASMKALKFFYYQLGDRLWAEYGFYDAFNITENWVASSYLAIDQGPIIIMIENHRTALLWNLFMSAPEVQAGLTKLGFNY